jgi:hypothetical protein
LLTDVQTLLLLVLRNSDFRQCFKWIQTLWYLEVPNTLPIYYRLTHADCIIPVSTAAGCWSPPAPPPRAGAAVGRHAARGTLPNPSAYPPASHSSHRSTEARAQTLDEVGRRAAPVSFRSCCACGEGVLPCAAARVTRDPFARAVPHLAAGDATTSASSPCSPPALAPLRGRRGARHPRRPPLACAGREGPSARAALHLAASGATTPLLCPVRLLRRCRRRHGRSKRLEMNGRAIVWLEGVIFYVQGILFAWSTK